MDTELQSATVEKTFEERPRRSIRIPSSRTRPRRVLVEQPKAWNAAENLRLNDEQRIGGLSTGMRSRSFAVASASFTATRGRMACCTTRLTGAARAGRAAEGMERRGESAAQRRAAHIGGCRQDALALVRTGRERKFYGDERTHGVLYDGSPFAPVASASLRRREDAWRAVRRLTGSGQWGQETVTSIDDGLGGTIDRKEFAAIVADHGGNQTDVREFLSEARLFAQGWPALSRPTSRLTWPTLCRA